MLTKYQDLPDYMSASDLTLHFVNFINEIESNRYDLLDALYSLVELADRQWHTYELIDEGLKEKIEKWLLLVLDFNSIEVIEYESMIIGRLGLFKLFCVLRDALSGNLKREIRKIIEETIEEIGDHVEDPYRGMRYLNLDLVRKSEQ